jgi:hypothetical protein
MNSTRILADCIEDRVYIHFEPTLPHFQLHAFAAHALAHTENGTFGDRLICAVDDLAAVSADHLT